MARPVKIKHIHIEPHTDGTAHFRAPHQEPDGKEGMSPMMGNASQNEESGSGTPEEMGAHVTRILKKHFGKSDGDADDKYSKHPAAGAFGR
jgi:hypothetical protein